MLASNPSLWGNWDFVKLLAAHTAATLGALMGALAFTAVLVLNASPQQMALLTAAGTAPGLVAGLPVGVWVDRLRRRPVLVAADVGRALALASVPLAYLAGALRVEQLYGVAFLVGLLDVFFEVAHPSFVPLVVRREQLVAANSAMSATASAVEIGAFGVSGWIAQLASAVVAVTVNALTFLFSGVLILLIGVRESTHKPANSEEKSASLVVQLGEGLRFVWRRPLLRALSAAQVLRGLSGGVIGAIILLYGVRELGFGPGVLGMIFAVGGLSSLGGAFLAPRLNRRFGIGPVLATMGLVMGVAVLFLPLAHGSLLLAATFLVAQQLAGDWAWAVYEINELSLRQTVTPDALRGRVNSAVRWLQVGAALIGSLLAGALVAWLGMRWLLALSALLILLASALLAFSPVRGVRETPQEASA